MNFEIRNLRNTIIIVSTFFAMVSLGFAVSTFSFSEDTVQANGNNVTNIAWLNPSGDELNIGGNLDLQQNTIQNVGGTDCSASNYILGDGSCGTPGGESLSDVLSNGNSAGSYDMDMNGNSILNIGTIRDQRQYNHVSNPSGGASSCEETIDSVSYSADYEHHILISAYITGSSVGGSDMNMRIYLDGNRIAYPEFSDMPSGWEFRSFFAMGTNVSAGSHTVEWRTCNDDGSWGGTEDCSTNYGVDDCDNWYIRVVSK